MGWSVALRGRLRSPLIDMRITQELLRRHGATQEQVRAAEQTASAGGDPALAAREGIPGQEK